MTLRDLISPTLTSFTLVVGVAIFTNFAQKAPPIISEEPLVVTTPMPTSTTTPLLTVTPSVTKKISTGTKPTPTTTKAPTPIPTAKPNPVATCIVLINGRKYNVISLKQTHSGPRGSFFVCGTDMTKAFKSQHGTNYSLIARYLI